MRPKPTLTYPLTNKQTVFDYVWHHFVVEKNPRAVVTDPSRDLQSACVYSTPTGGCAVGCLLTQEDRDVIGEDLFGYTHIRALRTSTTPTEYERYSMSRARPHFERFASRFHHSLDGFLVNLQGCHDESGSAEGAIEGRLRLLADTYSLTIPE
jgi:hypothetical protein